jgi:hypothetical protein
MGAGRRMTTTCIYVEIGVGHQSVPSVVA